MLLLDVDGNRLLAKYYQPPHAPAAPAPGSAPTSAPVAHLQGNQPSQLSARNPFSTFKEQRTFEKAVWEKTRRASGDIILYDGHLVLFKPSLDCILYVVGPAAENELMLSGLLSSLYESITLLLHSGQMDKRAVLENLDLVSLAVDETVDDGYVVRCTPDWNRLSHALASTLDPASSSKPIQQLFPPAYHGLDRTRPNCRSTSKRS